MKLLGYLFLLAIVLAVLGYARGWFTVEAASNPERADVKVSVDRDRISGDAKSVLDKVGAGSTRSESATPSSTSSSGTFVDGRITSVQAATRDLTVEVGSQTTTNRVAAGVPITRAGATIAFDLLQPDMKVRLSFDASKPTPNLIGVAILP